MSTLSLRLPDSLHRHIKDIAQKEGVSINQLISTAVAEKVSALSTEDYLVERAKKGSKARFKEILKKVSDRAPLPEDIMSQQFNSGDAKKRRT